MEYQDKTHEAAVIAAHSDQVKPTGRAWFSIVIIVLFVILSMIDRNAINLMVDPVRKSLGIEDFQVSLLQGPAFAVFFLLGSLLMGWMVDKYANNWLIYIGVTVWSLATIASGFSTSFIVLLIARCFVGFGESVLQPVGWNIMTKLFPKHKLATAIGMLAAGSQTGVAISFILTGFLVTEANQFSSISFLKGFEPWQLVFIAAGVPGLLLALLVFIIPAGKSAIQKGEKVKENMLGSFMWKNRAFLLCHFLGFGLLSIMMNAAAAWGPTYLLRQHNVDIKSVGIMLGVVGVPLSVAGVLFAGWRVDKAFKKGKVDIHLSHFAIMSMIIAVLGGIGFAFNLSLYFTLGCCGIIMFIQPFSGVAGASLQITTPPALRGKVSALFIMFYNALGLMLGPTVVGLFSSYFGQGQLGAAIALNYFLFSGIAAVLLWVGRKYAVRSYQRYGTQEG